MLAGFKRGLYGPRFDVQRADATVGAGRVNEAILGRNSYGGDTPAVRFTFSGCCSGRQIPGRQTLVHTCTSRIHVGMHSWQLRCCVGVDAYPSMQLELRQVCSPSCVLYAFTSPAAVPANSNMPELFFFFSWPKEKSVAWKRVWLGQRRRLLQAHM